MINNLHELEEFIKLIKANKIPYVKWDNIEINCPIDFAEAPTAKKEEVVEISLEEKVLKYNPEEREAFFYNNKLSLD